MKDIKDIKSFIPDFDAKTNPFVANLSGDHAYKRTERILAALYLITNHVREDEPVRAEVRSLGHKLLAQVVALRGGFRAALPEQLANVLATIRETITLVRMLQVAGYVSRPNVSVLAHALDELGQFLSGAQDSALSDSLQLERDDFIPKEQLPSMRTPDANPSAVRHTPTTPTQSRTQSGVSNTPKTPGRAVQTEVHSERRELLMDILAKSGPLGIKDIAAQMVGVSEKTVQRELLALVQGGTVRKEGEKRWSTYALSSASR